MKVKKGLSPLRDGTKRAKLSGSATENVVNAGKILEILNTGGCWEDIVRTLGFVPLVGNGRNATMGIHDLTAWAIGIYQEDGTKKQIAAELTRTLRADALNPTVITDIIKWDEDGAIRFAKGSAELSRPEAQAIKSVSMTENGIKVEIRDRTAPQNLLGKAVGLLVDRTELTGKNGGPIETAALETTDPVEAAKVYQRMMTGDGN